MMQLGGGCHVKGPGQTSMHGLFAPTNHQENLAGNDKTLMTFVVFATYTDFLSDNLRHE
jgi:hypothetical protein